MWPTILGGVFSLFGANRDRENHLADYERQRADTLSDYVRMREDVRTDYNIQRAHAQQDYFEQRADALDDYSSQFTRLRAAAEAGGFHPLAVIGNAQGLAQFGMASPSMASPSLSSPSLQTSNLYGSAFADFGLALGNSVAESQAARRQQVKEQTTRLIEKGVQATVRPKVGGIFDGKTSTNSGLVDFGVSNFPFGGGPLADARREVNVKPQENISGTLTVQGPHGRPWSIWGADGEPWGPLETFWVGAQGAVQEAWWHLSKEGRNQIATDWKQARSRASQFRQSLRRINPPSPSSYSGQDRSYGQLSLGGWP